MALVRDLPAALNGVQDDRTPAVITDDETSARLIEKDMLNIDKEADIPPSSMHVKFDVPSIRLELFDAKATSRAKLDGHSIIKLEIDNVETSYQQQSDGQQAADIKLAAITLSNTRPGASLYRDFLPKSTSQESQM